PAWLGTGRTDRRSRRRPRRGSGRTSAPATAFPPHARSARLWPNALALWRQTPGRARCWRIRAGCARSPARVARSAWHRCVPLARRSFRDPRCGHAFPPIARTASVPAEWRATQARQTRNEASFRSSAARFTRQADRLFSVLFARLGQIHGVAVVGLGGLGLRFLQMLLGVEILVGRGLLCAELTRLFEFAGGRRRLDRIQRAATTGERRHAKHACERQPASLWPMTGIDASHRAPFLDS